MLLLRRFDRDGDKPILFISAMSMIGSRDKQTRSYMEIVDTRWANTAQHPRPTWRPCGGAWFSMSWISNTDDHMRNHGFLCDGPDGWRLSPAYDLNPTPTDIKPCILSTAINEEDTTASLAVAMAVAGYFEVDDKQAHAIAADAGKAVATWRDEAAKRGIRKAQIDRMASAFEHEDLKAVLREQA
ncbi:MAG: HipA domain-containing protein [Candidatus Acidiferrum sp.]